MELNLGKLVYDFKFLVRNCDEVIILKTPTVLELVTKGIVKKHELIHRHYSFKTLLINDVRVLSISVRLKPSQTFRPFC